MGRRQRLGGRSDAGCRALFGLGLHERAGKHDAATEAATGTWSIVAVNVESGEVGVALATCLQAEWSISGPGPAGTGGGTPVIGYRVLADASPNPLVELARLVPGVGVIVAQGLVDPRNADRLDRAAGLLVAGDPPEAVLDAATSDDPKFEGRQYGAVTLAEGVASFTGPATNAWAGGTTGEVVSVQGNILVCPEVVDRALAVFTEVSGRPSATHGDALMAALEAGSAAGGDRRCSREQTALSAFIAVARPGDHGEKPHLWLAAPAQSIGGDNPVALLRQAYDATKPPAEERGTDDNRVPAPVWWALVPLAALVVGSALWAVRRRRGDPVV